MSCPFHLAFPVRDVQEAREFYTETLGCSEGRSAATWCDFNLFGHQVVAHRVEGYNAASSSNAVDGDPVPVPHFGAALSINQFHQLAERLKSRGVTFVIEPHLRFKGQPGEQWTMFFKDPSGNSLEFKAMTNPDNLFAKYVVKDKQAGGGRSRTGRDAEIAASPAGTWTRAESTHCWQTHSQQQAR